MILVKSKSLPFKEYTELHAHLSESESRTAQLAFAQTIKKFQADAQKLNQLKNRKPALVETLILRERDPTNTRATFRHHRGEYLSPREEVLQEFFLFSSLKMTPI